MLFELVNPRLRQLGIPGRASSITESELIHTPPSEYPRTRTWAQSLHAGIPLLEGLSWRPRLGGTGNAFVLFGDRCKDGDLEVHSLQPLYRQDQDFQRLVTLRFRQALGSLIPSAPNDNCLGHPRAPGADTERSVRNSKHKTTSASLASAYSAFADINCRSDSRDGVAEKGTRALSPCSVP